MDCFDADVLIYAAIPGHRLGARVAELLSAGPESCAGSVLLLPDRITEVDIVHPDDLPDPPSAPRQAHGGGRL